MNWKVRMRNPWFWVGIVSAVVSALRVDVNALTSWGAVWSCVPPWTATGRVCRAWQS